MTETGILNRDIAAELARMGHTDRLLIADAGLAIPDSTRVIDLSLAENVPTAVDVLKELLKHFSVEGIILSQATLDVSPSREREFKACFPPALPGGRPSLLSGRTDTPSKICHPYRGLYRQQQHHTHQCWRPPVVL